jgi:opacity protein-like surface antigen
MKRLLLALFVLTIFVNLAFAGDDSVPKSKSGDKAFLFTLSGLSNLGATSYMGGLGGKYYISDGNAIRASLGYATSTTTTKTTAGAGTSDEKQTGTTFIIAPAFIHNINANGPVLAYVGGEFIYLSSSSTTESPAPAFAPNVKNHVSTTGFGIAGIAGVEWFAWNNISLSAEYILAYTSTSGTTENTNAAGTTTTTDNPSTTTFVLGTTGIIPTVNFTLAVFW